MREIKFRAVQENTAGRWIFSNGYYFDEFNYWFTIPSKNKAIGYAKQHTVIIESLGQFTGLKDKTGKEIYEGDIVKCNYCDEDFGIVVWNESAACFSLKWNNACANARHTRIGVWCEVVGNKYEKFDAVYTTDESEAKNGN